MSAGLADVDDNGGLIGQSGAVAGDHAAAVGPEKETAGTAASRMAAKTADSLVRTNGRGNDGPNEGEPLREQTGENCFSGRDIVLPKQKS